MRHRPGAAGFIVPLAAGLCSVLLCLAGPAKTASGRIYDLLLRLRPSRAFSTEILLIEANEITGPAEWDGEGLAEGLAAMAAMGARYVSFAAPIALGNAGSATAPAISAAIEEEFATIDANVEGLFDAIRLGSLPAKDAPRYVAGLLQTIDEGKLRLLDAAAGAGSGARARLEGALGLFGHAYLAVDPLGGAAYGMERPLGGARGRGFGRATLDADGGRRRQVLLSDRGGARYELTAFAALLDRLGGPALALGPSNLVIKSVTVGSVKRDIEIPLSGGGLLIDWPRKASSFPRRLAWGELARARLLEDELAATLADLGKAGLLGPEAGALPGLRDYAAGLGEESIAKGRLDPLWSESRNRYFELAARSIDAAAEARATEVPRGLDAASIHTAFAGARQTNEELVRLQRRLASALAGSFCIAGPSRAAQGIRQTPFGGEPTEGLAQAAIVGSILARNFLRELQPWLGPALGALLALATAVAAAWLGRRWALAEGAILAFVGAVGCAVLFLATGAYLSPLAPALGPAAAAIAAFFAGKGDMAEKTTGASEKPL